MKPIETNEFLNKLLFDKKGKCPKHPKQFIIRLEDGTESCPTCYQEPENERLQKEQQDYFDNHEKRVIYDHLVRHSILDDKTLLNARILNYLTECSETATAKENALKLISYIEQGNEGGIVFQGKSGTGKSHLAYSILHEINEKQLGKKCLFVGVEKLFKLIKDSFNNKESIYTENYCHELMVNADVLVIDDLGAETGNIDTNKSATDFVSKILYSVYNARQGKSTITTTNLSGVSMKAMYDEKMISRLMSNCKPISFKEAKDKRIQKRLDF